MPRKDDDELKHRHGACVACFHRFAHGVWDGYTTAFSTLLRKTEYVDAAMVLDARKARDVNRFVRLAGKLWGLDPDELERLMRHHGAQAKTRKSPGRKAPRGR